MTGQLWRTARACNSGACVEVAPTLHGVRVRRSGQPGYISYDLAEWAAFIAGVKRGDFDDTLETT